MGRHHRFDLRNCYRSQRGCNGSVTVTVTSISTNVQSTTVTDTKGFYSFPALNVDHYNVSVNQTGFKNFLESGSGLTPILQSRLISSCKSASNKYHYSEKRYAAGRNAEHSDG